MIARPTPTQERWLLLAARYPALRAAAEAAGLGGGWKTTTWLGRVLGFFLGLLGTSLFAGVLTPFGSPWLVGGLIMMALAEWLVAQRRVFRSGIEEAVYLCGAVAAVVQLLIWSDGDNEAADVALITTAVLLVGWRLLNPLFTTLAAAGYSLSIAMIDSSLMSGRWHAREAAAFCCVLAVAGWIGGARRFERPAHDRMLDGLIILMPWCAFIWLIASQWRSREELPLALALAFAFFMVNLVIGLRRRQHAPLIGALGNLVCIAYVLHRLVHWPVHWEMIAAGSLLLIAAMILERALRDRREGITSSAIDEPAGLDLAALAGAAHLVPAPGTPPEPVQGQGGSFSGGGASGRF